MNSVLRTTLPLLFTLPLLAQQPPLQPPSLPKTPTTIQLDVTVTGAARNSKPIAGLTQANFTVLDNGAPSQILSFKAIQSPTTDPPIQIFLLIDTVNVGIRAVAYERDQIADFLKKSGPTLPYPLSFVVLSDKGANIQQTGSTNTADLLASLNSIETSLRTITRSTGFYGAQDRIQISLKALDEFAQWQQPKPGRKLLVWISPGWAYFSGPNIDLTTHDQHQLFNDVVGLSTELERARITLYNIDPLGVSDSGNFHTFLYEDYLKGVPSYKKINPANLTLQVLAMHTGGRVVNGGNDISSEIAACLDDTSAFYEITIPRSPADAADTLHTLQVKVPDTNLKVRTLFGYYAQP